MTEKKEYYQINYATGDTSISVVCDKCDAPLKIRMSAGYTQRLSGIQTENRIRVVPCPICSCSCRNANTQEGL